MKSFRNKHGLSKKFSIAIGAVVFIVILAFTLLAIQYSTTKIEKESKTRIESISRIAQSSLQSALWNIDKDTINDIGDALFQEKGVVFFHLTDGTNVLYNKKAPKYYNRDFNSFKTSSLFLTDSRDIYFKGDKLGAFQLVLSKEAFQEELRTTILSIILLTTLIVIAIPLTTIFITKRYIFHPLQKLELSAITIAEGKLETEIDTSGEDEIGVLAQAFNEMRESIKKLVGELTKTNQELDDSNRTLEQKVLQRTSELYKSEKKLEAILDHLRRRVYWKTLDGEIEGGNKKLANDLRLRNPSELKGKKESDIWINREVVKIFEDLTREVIEKKIEKLDEKKLLTDNQGEKVWYKIECVPILDEKSNVTDVLITFRDMTKEKQYEDELNAAKDDAENANKAKDQFLAKVSHDIRTPMNSINGFIKELLKSNLTPEQTRYMNIVISSAHYLLGIINDILDFSKMESGEFSIRQIVFKLPKVLDSVDNNFIPQAQQKGINFLIEKKYNIPDLLVGDDIRLEQVLNNLVGNAIRYTTEGEVKLEISCSDRIEKKATIQFSVKDTGIGIHPRDLEKIFQPYEQVGNIKTRGAGHGVGLGLTISQQLVTKMGGKIHVKSEPGKGSIFYFSIPFEIKNEVPQNSNTASDTSGAKQIDLTFFKERHVLVVEDDPGSQFLMQIILSGAGMVVDCAENGSIAAQKILANAYDIVLMDMNLPELCGEEVIKQVRQESRLGSLPIVAVTADAILGDQKAYLDMGANDYISKPIDAENLLRIIKKWIKKGGM